MVPRRRVPRAPVWVTVGIVAVTHRDSPDRHAGGRRVRLPVAVVAAAAALALAAALTACGVHATQPGTPSPGSSAGGGTPSAAASPGSSPASDASPGASATPGGTTAATPPPRPHFVAHPQPVPILVYHRILRRGHGPRLVTMSSATFEGQLAYLSAHGYEAVTLRRVYDAWTGAGKLPPRAVVITFDDGYADQVRVAAPLLRRYHWPAELDLVVDALYLGSSPPAVSLTPDMVRGLLDDGWGLESHTVDHAVLTTLKTAKLQWELTASRRRLEALFHVPVDFLCYPGGIYDRRVKLATREAGYLAATGTRFGAATPRDLFSLPRIYCYGGETPRAFGARLAAVLAAEAAR
jgi:peptidoglycan/xylan/chitin deacetylase (PgdA/CDA1 family)